jgi:hypothetical protein
MKFIFLILLLCAVANAENLVAAPDMGALPEAPISRPFWSFENKVDFGILGGLITADSITTQRGLNEGLRERNPLMRPFVTRGAIGQAEGSALGMGAALGTAYLLHRTHHYKAERIMMRLMLGGEGAMVGNNIAAIR